MNFMNILAIFIGGASYALAGFLKNYVRGEKFNPSKISKTLLIAGIMSIINSLLGLDSYRGLEELAVAGAGQTVLAEYLLKTIHRFLESRSQRWLG
ncbi:MAG TPA: hypothetical protein ENF33_06270 [Nitrososphaeria archaeon]|nr:hypothetical protein [Nitrososphaeria archaeon]